MVTRGFSRLVPFPQYSRNVRLAQQVFISPYWGDTLASKTHCVFSTSLTRYDHFDMPPYSVGWVMTASITLRTTALYHNRRDLSRLYYKKGGIP